MKWVLGIALTLAFVWMANRTLEVIDIKVCSRASYEEFKKLNCEEVMEWPER